MGSNWSYTITHIPTNTVIGSSSGANYLLDAEWTDIGSGEIPSAIITLSAKNGQFLTQTFSGNTPILARWDQVKLAVTDDIGNAFSKVFIIDKILPLYSQQEGDRVEIHLLGQEHWLQVVQFAKQFYFASAFSVFSDLAQRYNVNAAANQPLLYNYSNATYNQLPKWTANSYDFSVTEKPVYDGMMELIDKLGAPITSGGAGDYFELKILDGDVVGDPTNVNKLTAKVFSSGSTPASPVTISTGTVSNLAINTPKGEGGIEAPQATLLIAWGADFWGSLPVDFSQWFSAFTNYNSLPSWSSAITYPQSAYVNFNGTVYQSNIANNTSTPPTNWTAVTLSTYVTNTVNVANYSPWTNGRVTETINSGADMRNSHWTSQASPLLIGAMFDSNMVVQDGTYYRTYCDVRTPDLVTVPTGTTLSTKEIYNGTSVVFYRGFRVLVDNNLAVLGGVFNTNGQKDRFGNTYVNALVINNGNNNGDYTDWDCILTTTSPAGGSAITLLNNFQVACRDEAKNFIYNSTTSHWVDNSGAAKAQDCFHPYNAIANTTGASSTSFGTTSAIYIQYQFSAADILSGLVVPTKNYYSAGAWYCLSYPFPNTEDFLPLHSLGDLYGGTGHNPAEPLTVDSLNMHLTHTGDTGFNKSTSPDLGPLQALAFQIKFLIADTGHPTVPLSLVSPLGTASGTWANFKFRCALYDTADNVVIQDFVVAFHNNWQDVQLPLQSFQTYRARIPPTFGDINTLIPPPGLNVLNVFLWRNIKMLVIQWQDVYDDQGRFKPESSAIIQQAVISANFDSASSPSIRLHIDSLRWSKPVMATSGVVTDWNVEPLSLQRQNITDYIQLKNDAITWQQIYKFQHKEFTISTTGRFDIAFGDSFYLNDPNLVSDSDNGANTIKLVAKRITYNIKKSAVGPGGFTRVIYGSKRFQS